MKIYNLYNKTLKVYFWEDYFHTYTLTDKDKKDRLISVSAVSGVIDKSGPLMGWVAKMMALFLLDQKKKGNDKITEELVDRAKREYRNISKEAQNIGTEIHKWIEEWIQCNGVGIDMPDDEKVLNGVTAFLKWQVQNKAKFLESERIVYSKKHKYCGTLDAVARIGKDLVLIDFKSSKRNPTRKDGLGNEMQIQVAGYRLAWEEEMGKQFDKSMILRFDKETGEFDAVELDEYEKDKKVFLSCLDVKKRLKELSKK